MIKDRNEVEIFLQEFKIKMEIFEILFRDDRGKNRQALLELEISPSKRKEMLKHLAGEDFSEVIKDILNKGEDMWVFGIQFKEVEIYIKISIGPPNSQVICISFHKAEYKMMFPFKNK